jgi:hypothetical protein
MWLTIQAIIVALALGYFASRIMLRLPIFPATAAGLPLVHAASALAIILLIIIVKYPVDGFSVTTPITIGLAQLAWFLIDRARDRHPGQVAAGGR